MFSYLGWLIKEFLVPARALRASVLSGRLCFRWACAFIFGVIYNKIPGPSMCSPRERALRAPVFWVGMCFYICGDL